LSSLLNSSCRSHQAWKECIYETLQYDLVDGSGLDLVWTQVCSLSACCMRSIPANLTYPFSFCFSHVFSAASVVGLSSTHIQQSIATSSLF
jgi:hypothetical protein